MKILQKGFNYSQDGPGNRLVYHLQGCNFACKWCSNADSIPLENPKAKDYSVEELFDEIMRSRMMFFDGGGVTFTGGEACLQGEELIELLQKLRENGIHTAIETNGSIPVLKKLCRFVDWLIVDFKHYDDTEHKKWVGVSNNNIKAFLSFVFAEKIPVHIRIPVVNGVNDNPQGFVDFFKPYDTSDADFEFLAYHEFGKDKWKGNYQIENGFVSPEKIKEFTDLFEKNGMKTVVT
ncbi:MAG: radical SAM protein [Clostridia bacterium]|nr:radical SAM protein [Clostridia bacterium]